MAQQSHIVPLNVIFDPVQMEILKPYRTTVESATYKVILHDPFTIIFTQFDFRNTDDQILANSLSELPKNTKDWRKMAHRSHIVPLNVIFDPVQMEILKPYKTIIDSATYKILLHDPFTIVFTQLDLTKSDDRFLANSLPGLPRNAKDWRKS